MRIFPQIFFTALTLFGLFSQEFVQKNESNHFSSFLFSCYENAQEKDADENHALLSLDFHQPNIGAGGADEDEFQVVSDALSTDGNNCDGHYYLYCLRILQDSMVPYHSHWLNSFQQRDILVFQGARKLFA